MSSAERDFEDWWKVYPRKVDKGHARKAYVKARKVASQFELAEGVTRFATASKAKGTPPEFIPHAATWLNGERWLDEDLRQKVPVAQRRIYQPDPEVPADERMTPEMLQELKVRMRGVLQVPK